MILAELVAEPPGESAGPTNLATKAATPLNAPGLKSNWSATSRRPSGAAVALLAIIDAQLRTSAPVAGATMLTYLALLLTMFASEVVSSAGNSYVGQDVIAALRRDLTRKIIQAPDRSARTDPETAEDHCGFDRRRGSHQRLHAWYVLSNCRHLRSSALRALHDLSFGADVRRSNACGHRHLFRHSACVSTGLRSFR